MKLRSLNTILDRQYLNYIQYLILSTLLASITTLAISFKLEKFQECQSIENRINYLQDVFAREIIIGSTETLNFELNKIKNEFGLKRISFKKSPSQNKLSCSVTSINPTSEHEIAFGGNILGRIELEQNMVFSLKSSDFVFAIPLMVIVVLSFGFIFSLKKILLKKIFTPFTYMLNEAKAEDKSNTKFNYDGDVQEFEHLKNQLNDMLASINEFNDRAIQLEKEASIGEIATQVAHDIRSPLEVLKSLREELNQVPDETRRRIQLSINRIEEISFNLLKSQRMINDSHKIIQSEELFSLIESIVTEKKIEFKKIDDVEITHNSSLSATGHFSNVNRGALKSIISNLINNSVESFIHHRGNISVCLSHDEKNYNTISISDNGPGIPDHLKDNLFHKGFTTKDSGNGLGLYNAKKTIEQFGGNILFSSNSNGTIFSISLPASPASETFLDSINLRPYNEIIILDDDTAFHDIWGAKLEQSKIPIKNYYSANKFFEDYSSLSSKTLLLTDYETMDVNSNGLDVIKKLNHYKHSILVTARSEESYIKEQCSKLKVKILPKSMIQYTKIETQSKRIVLIDDDRIIHVLWKSFFKNKYIDLKTFTSIENFLTHSEHLDIESQIFLDSDLGNNIKGEIASKMIADKGFKNIYLSTGYERHHILKPEWIINIYPKDLTEIFGDP